MAYRTINFLPSTVIEVASGEYGHEYLNRMVEMIDNGRVTSWRPSDDTHDRYKKLYNFIEYQEFPQFEEEINPSNLQFKCSGWEQFTILFRRLSKQMYRNKVKLHTNVAEDCLIKSYVFRIISRFGSTCTSFWGLSSADYFIKWEMTPLKLCLTSVSASLSSLHFYM